MGRNDRHLSILEDHDAIALQHRVQPVRDGQHGAIVEGLAQRCLNQAVRLGVDGRRRLVQQQDLFHQRTPAIPFTFYFLFLASHCGRVVSSKFFKFLFFFISIQPVFSRPRFFCQTISIIYSAIFLASMREGFYSIGFTLHSCKDILFHCRLAGSQQLLLVQHCFHFVKITQIDSFSPYWTELNRVSALILNRSTRFD